MAFKFIDLFAGLGGFHLALEQLGCECVFASELKDDLRKLYKINFPKTKRVEGDITLVDLSAIPQHDILCAGFPCQPFSQAGKRQGFDDENGRGNLFGYICKIIEIHRPQFVLLENVSNLKGHDDGRTWKIIKQKLEDLRYEVPEPEILSPHQFGIPQHRKRIYIVAADKDKGGVGNFSFPEPQKKGKNCDIHSIIDEDSKDYFKLKPDTRHQLEVWQEFIDQTVAHGHNIPRFPVWAMEFGADYPIYKSPAYMSPDELIGKHGKLGREIVEGNLEDCLLQLPKYAQTKTSRVFPSWKIKYIEHNREFYRENKEWLDGWLANVKQFDNSHLKFEWNCGIDGVNPTIEDKIVQFRASGIRVKRPDFSPALNLVGTQVPILPWIKLPKETLMPGEPDKGRYMTIVEAAKLQGMSELKFGDDSFHLSTGRCYEALGNAVNVDIVFEIATRLIGR